MKVFFFNVELYVNFEDESQNYILRLPILNSGLATEYRDYIPQRVLREQGSEAMNKRALSEVLEFNPDLLVYETPHPSELLNPAVLEEIMKRGIPILTAVWDSYIHLGLRDYEEEWLRNCNYFAVIESITNWYRYRYISKDILTEDKRIPGMRGFIFGGGNHIFTDVFKKKHLEKKYDVSLIGSNEGQRVYLLNYLREELPKYRIDLYNTGGNVDDTKGVPKQGLKQTADRVSIEHFIEVINQSKICLSSQTQPDRSQIKGRIFEYLACGAFILSDSNPDLKRLIPDSCIVYYDSPEDCVNKIVYYINHEEERIKVADSGYQWFHQQFNYKKFWSKFLKAVVDGDVASVNKLGKPPLTRINQIIYLYELLPFIYEWEKNRLKRSLKRQYRTAIELINRGNNKSETET